VRDVLELAREPTEGDAMKKKTDRKTGQRKIPRIYSNPGPTDLGRQLGELKRIQVVKTKIPNPRRPT
jgi:hypothetical protein